MADDERRRREIAALAAQAALRRAARVLAGRGITVVALKGVVAKALLYDTPSERDLADVDLLVGRERFDEACAALGAAGYEALWPDVAATKERTFADGGGGLRIDLHREIAQEGQFRLSGRDLIARSVDGRALLGCEVRIPEAHDLLAHAVAHMALEYLSSGRVHRPGELERFGTRLQLEPAAAARRLRETGLDGAARYVFALAPSPFAAQVLEALGSTQAQVLGARLVLAGRGLLPQSGRLGPLVACVLHRRPSATARWLASAVRKRVAGQRGGRGPRPEGLPGR